MWEEDPEYQASIFNATKWILLLGTALLGFLAFLSGDGELFGNWISVIVAILTAWLFIAIAVYALVRLVSFRRSNAKFESDAELRTRNWKQNKPEGGNGE